MKVHKLPDELPVFRKAVITIGTFDGVHTGHQQIIQQLKDEALKIGGETVIVTFDPHPRKIIGPPSKEIKLINTLEEKIELLALKGINHLAICPFTEEFSCLTAHQYIQEFLIEKFHPHTIIIGYDHRFGKGREGDFHLFEKLSEPFGYVLKEIPVHILNSISVSSTRIRDAITRSAIDVANELLGYPFFFEGRVLEGNKLGKTIGYPTANLKIEDEEKLIPGNGVYAVQCEISDFEPAGPLMGMMNIGVRPTIGGTHLTIEVHIFDFDADIYGRILRVHLKKFLREERKFTGLDSLKAQLEKDKNEALNILLG